MIWPPTSEMKYWWNLYLVICDCEAKFHYVILACGYGEVNFEEIKFGSVVGDHQTAIFNYPPNFRL